MPAARVLDALDSHRDSENDFVFKFRDNLTGKEVFIDYPYEKVTIYQPVRFALEMDTSDDDVVTNEPLQVKNADNNMLFKVFSSGEEDIEQLSINQKGAVDLNDVESFEPLKEQGSTETLVLDDLIADDESKRVPSFEDSDKDLDPSLIAETKDTDLNIETYDVQPVVDPLDDLLDQKMTLV